MYVHALTQTIADARPLITAAHNPQMRDTYQTQPGPGSTALHTLLPRHKLAAH